MCASKQELQYNSQQIPECPLQSIRIICAMKYLLDYTMKYFDSQTHKCMIDVLLEFANITE